MLPVVREPRLVPNLKIAV